MPSEQERLLKRWMQLQERYHKAGFAERMRIVREMQDISERLGTLQTAPYKRSTHIIMNAIMAMGAVGELGAAQSAAEQITPAQLQQRLGQAGLKLRPEAAEAAAKAINAERAQAMAAQLEAQQAATAEQMAKAAAKAAKRAPFTKEASEKWLEIYRASNEQAAARTRAIERATKAAVVIGGVTAAANIYEASSVLYNAFAGNLDSRRLLQYGEMRNASDEATRKLRERELQLRQAEYQLRLQQYLERTGQLQGYGYGGTRIAPLTYEQQYALEQARHYWTMQRGQMAAEAERAKIREAAMWRDWTEAREHAREMQLEQEKGRIKLLLQQGKYMWENYMQERAGQIKAFLTDKEQSWRAWREYWDDVREHIARLTQQYQKAVLEDELNRRATAYKVAGEAAKAQIEVAKEAAMQRIQYYWERKRDFIKAIRDHARLTQIDASRLWDLWRKELKKVKKAIEKGEAFVTALAVPDSPVPVVVKVDPREPGVIKMVTPEGKEVRL